MTRKAAISLIATAGLLAGLVPTSSAQSKSIRVGKTFPTFTATEAVTGKPFKLEDLRGRVVLIDFWATWCGPCLRTLPRVKQVYKTYHKQGLEIVGISFDQTISAGKSFVEREKMEWHHVIEGGKWNTRLAREYGINSIPRMILLDTKGVVVEAALRERDLIRAIEKALKKTPPVLDDPKSADDEAQAELEEADALLEKKQYAEAAEAYEAIERKYRDSEVAKEATKRLEQMRSNKKIAAVLEKTEAEKQKEVDQKQAADWLNMARSLAKSDNHDGARKYYERIIKEYPESEEAGIAKAELAELPE